MKKERPRRTPVRAAFVRGAALCALTYAYDQDQDQDYRLSSNGCCCWVEGLGIKLKKKMRKRMHWYALPLETDDVGSDVETEDDEPNPSFMGMAEQ